MGIVDKLKLNIQNAFNKLGQNVDLNDIVIEHSRDKTHGDYATNAAMKLCRLFGKAPRDVATLLINELDMSEIEKVEIAGPGFINFFMKNDSLQSIVKTVVEKGDEYGKQARNHIKFNVEFVSANPTGLLHVGTARGAAYGDSLCRILDFAGYDVTREYYINDAGVQITHLGESIEARYRELMGLPFTLPEDGYHGEDVIEVAKQIYKEYGPQLLEKEDRLEVFKQRGMEIELERIKDHLKTFGVTFDVFSSEKAIRGNSAIEKEIEFLKPHTYVQDGATFLKTTDYLDDKDRVIIKSDGDYTYYMPDIVYHVNKMSRGFDQLIDVLGADHHGYINRMKSALMMHGYKPEVLEIELIQMVRFIKNGQEFKASKRAGDAITLHEICEEVGVDAMRYFFAMRAQSGHLDFDMDLAKEQSSNNPVYYAQYAHARLCSILESAKDIALDLDASKLSKNSEMDLLKHLANFPNVVLDAAKDRAPYKITNYIHDLAELVHAFYTECRVIDRDNLEVSGSRLALCKACKQVMKNALYLIGVSAPTHM
ncbi:MAG: arginine--tRNA ligase [Bacilli bacterium]|nr:arginine--tRNA ligase [Bacilli bacterium]